MPITIAPDLEPEPDIALVRVDTTRYWDRHPAPEDVYLLIEVSDSTLNYDRNRKAKVYAKARIPEYWVVDVNRRCVLVFREPEGERYQVEQTVDLTAKVAPVAFSDVELELAKLFLV